MAMSIGYVQLPVGIHPVEDYKNPVNAGKKWESEKESLWNEKMEFWLDFFCCFFMHGIHT